MEEDIKPLVTVGVNRKNEIMLSVNHGCYYAKNKVVNVLCDAIRAVLNLEVEKPKIIEPRGSH